MMKKVLIITGSPRANGNSNTLAKAFAKGAEEAGCHVAFFDAAKANIGPCNACNACYKNGKACAFSEDFSTLADMMATTDVLVFATPLYWFGFSAQMKCVIDKFYSFCVAEKVPPVKETFLLATCEAPDEDYAVLTGNYERMIDYLKWADGGRILVTSVGPAGAIENTDALVEAEEMGRSL
ncbi:MAG: flavodoxin family protein [Abditibacteriota bacterium]|nr:flavodoxin family protein [Abditibacteriota bacterium]